MAYEEYLRRQLPVWLLGPTADKLITTIGSTLDAYLEAAKAAVRASMLADCPQDAVEHHTRARLLERIPGETIEALRARGLDAWEFWSTLHERRTEDEPSGLEAMLMAHMGLEAVKVYDQANDNWQAGAMPDGDDANGEANRQTIVITQPHGWVRAEVGDVVVGPQTLVGITMTTTELSRIRGLYRKHRPADLVGNDIWVVFDSTPPEDVLNFHDAPDALRLPLLCSLVGYQGNGAHHHMTVGQHMIVGREFT